MGRPAAVSASKAAALAPRDQRTAAVPIAASPSPEAPTAMGTRVGDPPVPGPYGGLTGGRFPQVVEFRFLGSGIRDLTVDGRQVARWIRVGTEGGTAIVGSTRIKVSWTSEREVSGWIQRGRGSKAERVGFSAAHRFRSLAS